MPQAAQMLLKRRVRSEKISETRKRLTTAIEAIAGFPKSMLERCGIVKRTALTKIAEGTEVLF